MLGRVSFAVPTLMLAALLSACATQPKGESLSDYVGVGFTNVKTLCGGGYQVYQQPVNGRLLVAAYAISEAYKRSCEARNGRVVSPGRTGVRYEDAAMEYIAATPSLKGCTIVSGTQITELHSEFVLSCPATSVTVIKAKG